MFPGTTPTVARYEFASYYSTAATLLYRNVSFRMQGFGRSGIFSVGEPVLPQYWIPPRLPEGRLLCSAGLKAVDPRPWDPGVVLTAPSGACQPAVARAGYDRLLLLPPSGIANWCTDSRTICVGVPTGGLGLPCQLLLLDLFSYHPSPFPIHLS